MADMEAAQAEAADAPMEPANDPLPLSVVTLPLMQVIKTAQAQHGLRHGDYTRYRYVRAYAACSMSQCTVGALLEPAANCMDNVDCQPLSPADSIAHDGCSACTRR